LGLYRRVLSNQQFAPLVNPDRTALRLSSMQALDSDNADDSTATTTTTTATLPPPPPDAITKDNPLRVIIAGAGVGGLSLANVLCKHEHVHVTVLEQTAAFKRFGGPIQLASNAMQILSEMDPNLYNNIQSKFTVTGDKMNGIKDGIRTEWYAKFDLASPASSRNMPYTGVIDRPDLQELYLQALPPGTVHNGASVDTYRQHKASAPSTTTGPVDVVLSNGTIVTGDVLIGADGIWSKVRATMRGEPAKGEGSGASYSGYTVFAGELAYASPDNGQVGYKVYIGPGTFGLLFPRTLKNGDNG
jgi:zeaxanthin epoxidase